MSRQDDTPPSFAVNPQTPIRELRHQSSLEHIFHFTLSSPQPTRAVRDEAFFLYGEILGDCEAAGVFVQVGEDFGEEIEKVYIHSLFRALLEFAPKEAGRLNIVRMILHGLFSFDRLAPHDRSLTPILPLARAWHTSTKEDDRQPMYQTLRTIAADFLLGFFVPLTAQATCTPRLSGRLSAPSTFDAAPTQGPLIAFGIFAGPASSATVAAVS